MQQFAELVRHGPANEAERLWLLDTHRRRVDAQAVGLVLGLCCAALLAGWSWPSS
ncbi:hypothetical protein GCM10009544_01460 [Streptomyces stramineus]|uniref:Uncharacterized protein n=1 Tax=Streptomyces stramineus TaxID=173861 RepID=A0ABN0ZBH7_9ACTN